MDGMADGRQGGRRKIWRTCETAVGEWYNGLGVSSQVQPVAHNAEFEECFEIRSASGRVYLLINLMGVGRHRLTSEGAPAMTWL